MPFLAFLLLLITAPVQLPETIITARAVGILDGDTIRALTNDNQLLRVRLRNIDAPEKAQAFGQAAKQNLSRYIFDRNVELHVFGTDHYGRILVWVYDKYIGENSPDVQARYRDAEAEARAMIEACQPRQPEIRTEKPANVISCRTYTGEEPKVLY